MRPWRGSSGTVPAGVRARGPSGAISSQRGSQGQQICASVRGGQVLSCTHMADDNTEANKYSRQDHDINMKVEEVGIAVWIAMIVLAVGV